MLDIINPENHLNWWCLLLLMLFSFILGYFLSKWLNEKPLKDALNNCQEENERLRVLAGEKPLDNKSENSTEKPSLNFASFGKATEAEKDDLKKITGVGPLIENKLNSLGIYKFDQISRFSDEDIKNVTDLIKFFPGRILRDDWRGQSNILKKNK